MGIRTPRCSLPCRRLRIRGFVRDNLPVIPDTFTLVSRQVKTEKGYKPDSSVVAQIKTVARLFKESEQIIVATDAGREGELIFRYLYHLYRMHPPVRSASRSRLVYLRTTYYRPDGTVRRRTVPYGRDRTKQT